MTSDPQFGASQRRPIATINWLLVILLILITGMLWRERMARQDLDSNIIVARGDLAQDELTTIQLFRQASRSVVLVISTNEEIDDENPQVSRVEKSGSGFVWNSSGNIVTNFHVVKDHPFHLVILPEGERLRAVVRGVAPEKDIAVLMVEPKVHPLVPIQLGDSKDLQVGQKVFAIGNPFGLDRTLTTGVISGLGREVSNPLDRPIYDAIQTDAAINPGNSGGPLLDSSGRVIGINTMAIRDESTGFGFAVPIDTVYWIVPQLIQEGRIKRVGIGIRLHKLSIAALLGTHGVLIEGVLEGSPATEAGLRPTRIESLENAVRIYLGDTITAADNEPVLTGIDLFRVLDKKKLGDTVTLTIVRDRKEMAVPLVLKELE